MADDNLTPNTSRFNLHIEAIEGEPRIMDTELAKRLGFANPIDIRKLVRRHEPALAALGVIATVAKTSDAVGGRPATEFFLNRRQAIFITAKSETAEATAITIEIIDRFDAYERGMTPAFNIPKTLPEALRLAADLAETVDRQKAELQVTKPEADGFDRISGADGTLSITEAAKTLQLEKIKDLTAWLNQHRWIYRRPGGGSWLAYQDKIQAGHLVHKVTTVEDTKRGGDKVVEQVRITPAGLTRLAKALNPDLIGKGFTMGQEGRA